MGTKLDALTILVKIFLIAAFLILIGIKIFELHQENVGVSISVEDIELVPLPAITICIPQRGSREMSNLTLMQAIPQNIEKLVTQAYYQYGEMGTELNSHIDTSFFFDFENSTNIGPCLTFEPPLDKIRTKIVTMVDIHFYLCAKKSCFIQSLDYFIF